MKEYIFECRETQEIIISNKRTLTSAIIHNLLNFQNNIWNVGQFVFSVDGPNVNFHSANKVNNFPYYEDVTNVEHLNIQCSCCKTPVKYSGFIKQKEHLFLSNLVEFSPRRNLCFHCASLNENQEKRLKAVFKQDRLNNPAYYFNNSWHFGSFDPVPLLEHFQENVERKVVLVHEGEEYSVNFSSLRINTLKKSQECACCGLKGTHFKLSRQYTNKAKESPHVNLFSDCGMMITCDHIEPLALGGKDHISNTQTLCYRCNQVKGCQQVSLEELRKQVGINA